VSAVCVPATGAFLPVPGFLIGSGYHKHANGFRHFLAELVERD
jgi:hypothetical protein